MDRYSRGNQNKTKRHNDTLWITDGKITDVIFSDGDGFSWLRVNNICLVFSASAVKAAELFIYFNALFKEELHDTVHHCTVLHFSRPVFP